MGARAVLRLPGKPGLGAWERALARDIRDFEHRAAAAVQARRREVQSLANDLGRKLR